MIAHHSELYQNMLQLFKDAHLILKNATKVEIKDEFNLIYFKVGDIAIKQLSRRLGAKKSCI